MGLRVLHINSYFSVSPFYQQLYDRQVRAGMAIVAYVPVSTAYPKAKQFPPYTKLDFSHQPWQRLIFGIKHKSILNAMSTELAQQSFDIIHAHSLFSNGFLAMKLSRQKGIPYIAAVRNTDANVFFKRMLHLRSLGREILKNAQAVVWISTTLRDQVLRKYVSSKEAKCIESKSYVVPNGIDQFWLENIGKARKQPADNQVNIVSAGLVSKNKNPLTTLKACQLLQRQGMKTNFTVIGKVANKKLAKRLGQSPIVTLLPQGDKSELLQLYKQQDVFVMPSITETFGIAYAEAMSQGLPVIYSSDQGFDGQFEQGDVGFAVNSQDAAGIAKAIASICKNYTQISRRCIDSAKRFDWDEIAQQYTDIYQESLHQPRPQID